jgi:hypothetical protein
MIARYGLVVLIIAALETGTLAQQQPAPGKPAPAAEAPPPAPAAPPRPPMNVRVEVTITEQRGKSSPTRKLLSMIVADGFRNSIRSQESFFPPMEVPLNIDVAPTILANNRGENVGRIRLMLNLEYDLPGAAGGAEKKTSTGEWERVTTKSSVRENLYVFVDDGKPLVVAQSADPVSDRQVTVEVRATILK